jgi:DNA (cytosine-5)-methyltransferase 1
VGAWRAQAFGDGWRTLFANDFDPAKADAYAANWGERPRVADIWSLTSADISGRPDLAWASSPCQDFSLAGARAGLAGERSSALLGFWRLMQALGAEGRAPRVIVVENVVGLLTASGGRDFTALCTAMTEAGYRVGALELDAAAHVPQSRPRVFVVAARGQPGALAAGMSGPGHTRAVLQAHAALPERVQAAWAWWRLPAPPRRNTDLASVLLPDDAVRCWWSAAKTERLVEQMQPLHRARLDLALRRRPHRRRRLSPHPRRRPARRGALRRPRRLPAHPGGGFVAPDRAGGERRRPARPLAAALARPPD